MVNAGADSGKVGERIAEFGLGAAWLQSFPARFWDVFRRGRHSAQGHDFRDGADAARALDESERHARGLA